MNQPITRPPPPGRQAKFSADFGQRVLLTVDTEEAFDWNKPFSATEHELGHLSHLSRFQSFCEDRGIIPCYLVDWPVATSPLAKDVLTGAVAAGRAEIGVQLHPWVNPPFDEELNKHNSYAGNLPAALEAEKMRQLYGAIVDNFGVEPKIYRAGRYGVGPDTADLLRCLDIAIDSSVRTHFNYASTGGPDFRAHALAPYWLDDEEALLELPLTTVFWGLLRRQGRALYPAIQQIPHLPGLMARLSLLERIPLTPEGVSANEAIRGIDIALDDGLPLLVLSFHSPSLVPGNTPYVRTKADLERLFDWLTRIYAYLELREVRNTSVAEILKASRT